MTPPTTIAIGGTTMGQGSDGLGEILLKSFLHTLTQSDTPPHTLLLFNSGVTLTAPDTNTLCDLQTLAERGTRILSCGTCTNYYGITPAVGEISNMPEIVKTMQASENLIQL
ncbi:MAG: sulfurtransferase-like selenium metabolism protein YedF [Oscillospiraceae bacterium]|nr:sulfurtransferase-like selenium metabolism protein YedF [Oscillospiraceae bacterium]